MIRKSFELVWEHTSEHDNKTQTQTSVNQFTEFDFIKSAIIKACDAKGETFIIKLTEDIIEDDKLLSNFAENVSILKKCGINVAIVHDHGKLVAETLKTFGIDEKFINGSRVTDHKTAKLMEMVVSGYINKKIVSKLCSYECKAIGISGKDANMIQAHNVKVTQKREGNLNSIIDFGFVGEPVMINPEILIDLEDAGIIPVISPVAYGSNGSTYLLDADLTAAILASALTAEKLIFFSTEGPLKTKEEVISELNIEELKTLLNKEKLDSKFVNMAEATVSAIDNAASTVYILNSAKKDAILFDLFTDMRAGSIVTSF
jgi:acetylglutamate kinase